ncbi:unnamed protein product [Sphenostylis stenocarpa]|uniref:Uncharacterized protein n=1 Tax=Sphenostylis stenocarpa TaxID=92480 RepID=A0AA86VWL3_9FABA|nr:unnamed protein product [Sphenostylis stenocarpa]
MNDVSRLYQKSSICDDGAGRNLKRVSCFEVNLLPAWVGRETHGNKFLSPFFSE